MNAPFFTIVIPVHNGLTHDLPVCLNSIWEQSLDKRLYEVICVDDCSTDESRQWLKEQQKKHPNLYLIENKVNTRQGGARNKGVKAARGKYIVFIDQDVRASLVAQMVKNPRRCKRPRFYPWVRKILWRNE